MVTQSFHTDLTRGLHFEPTQTLDLGFYGGISPSIVLGGLGHIVLRPDLQIMCESQLKRTTKRGDQLWFSGGYRIGFYGVSPQIQWGWGRTW